MPEYRAVRERHGFLQMVKTPKLAAEVTLQPIQAFAVDAAIIFADILPPLEGMGLRLTYEHGEGPVIHNPIRSEADIAALAVPDPHETVRYTLDAIRLTVQELHGRVPLIGFSGAPFTLASYAIEGGSSREYRRTKALMYGNPQAWHALMEKLTELTIAYLRAQIAAGAQAVQLFDSWVGALAPDDFEAYVLPFLQRIATALKHSPETHDVPLIYFGTDTAGLLGLLRQIGADVVGVDWRIRLDAARALLGAQTAVQGNLDPHVLFAPWPEIERRAADVLRRNAGAPGHVFNLGHGILTETPVEHVRRLAEFVHAFTGAS